MVAALAPVFVARIVNPAPFRPIAALATVPESASAVKVHVCRPSANASGQMNTVSAVVPRPAAGTLQATLADFTPEPVFSAAWKRRMESLQRVKLAGFDVVIAELESLLLVRSADHPRRRGGIAPVRLRPLLRTLMWTVERSGLRIHHCSHMPPGRYRPQDRAAVVGSH